MFLMIDNTDTYDDIYNAYASKNNMTPTFPFVVGSDATSLYDLFTGYSGGDQSNLGGPVWVVSPDRSYLQVSYAEKNMTDTIQMALDNRNVSVRRSLFVNNNDVVKRISSHGNKLSFDVSQSGRYDLSLFSANGRLAYMQNIDCRSGKSSVDIRGIAQGSYIVRISGATASASRTCFINGR